MSGLAPDNNTMNRLIRERDEYRKSYMEYMRPYNKVLEMYMEQLRVNHRMERNNQPHKCAMVVQFKTQ